MPAQYPRVNVLLERALYDTLGWLAQREGVSVSTKAHDLLRDALERHEDLVLAEIAAKRERTQGRTKMSTHDNVWMRLPTAKRR